MQLELRMAFNQKLLDTDHFPDWAVNFKPPMNLLSTERAVESTVGFRYEHACQSIKMLIDLMQEESDQLTNDIQATMASLECHYNEPAVQGYNISEATESLRVFMQRTRDSEESELARCYAAIHAVPLAALWVDLPPGITLPLELYVKPLLLWEETYPLEITIRFFEGQGGEHLMTLPGEDADCIPEGPEVHFEEEYKVNGEG